MDATEVVECYVKDVAVQLPRRQRNDVAFELRALLNEGLQDRAEDAGRAPDAAMATEFLNAFGQPAEVAARYRAPLTIIDPEDGRAFLRAALIGVAVIWLVGGLKFLQQPPASGAELLGALGQWWGATVLFSLWWPGLLVLSFAAASWARLRWPQPAQWQARASDRMPASRAALVLGVVGILCGTALLMQPSLVLDLFWGGRAAPAAYQALSYTEAFRQRQAPLLFGLLLLNVPLLVAVIVKGRRPPLLQKLEIAHALALCAVMAWSALSGPIMRSPAGDQAMRFALLLFTVLMLVQLGLRLHRRVKPAPD